jgi:two-component system nitrate/nitrite sensor histidine kinase NarX
MSLSPTLPDRRTLGFKLTALTVGALLLALVAIGLTLWSSWQLEGGAAAVNDAGSERMRTYRLLSTLSAPDLAPAEREARIRDQVLEFERVLHAIDRGDPTRPLFLPKASAIRQQIDAIDREWVERMRPTALQLAGEPDDARRLAGVTRFAAVVDDFAGRIDRLVSSVERENARANGLLRSLQMALIAFAVLGAIGMIYLLFLLIIQPVTRLQDGIARMQRNDFGARLPVETRDEFGRLSEGFNRMAGHLQDVYATLEQRVAEKTGRLAARNRELGLLYGISSFLGRPASDQELCRGFLQRLMVAFGAKGGAVRLTDHLSAELHLFVQEGLPEAFIEKERCLPLGHCRCGGCAQTGHSQHAVLPANGENSDLFNCSAVGYRGVCVSPIRFQNRILGVFNLFFTEPRTPDADERRLLETLGRQLGVAIENRRLSARDREHAVSDERNLLAQELHDSIAQSLAFLKMQTQLLERALREQQLDSAKGTLSRIREGVEESYADVRELLTHFRTRVSPAGIDTVLGAALERLAAQTGARVRLESNGSALPLSPEVQVQVLHVMQEALSNVRKHARAHEVTLRIERGPERVRFAVRDDGCGFDTTRSKDSREHVGLAIMRERVRRIGAELVVQSAPGQGTEVTLTVPFASEGIEAAQAAIAERGK